MFNMRRGSRSRRLLGAVVMAGLVVTTGPPVVAAELPSPAEALAPAAPVVQQAPVDQPQPGLASVVATRRYVALGDSYSAGSGTRAYINDGTGCERSRLAYPSLIAKTYRYQVVNRACAGATIADIRSTQLGALTANTRLVTVTAGSNDARLIPTIAQCRFGYCEPQLDQGQRAIRTQVPARMDALLADISRRSPKARVVVVGYPRLFGTRECAAMGSVSDHERRRLNQSTDQLNRALRQATLRAAAKGKNVRFANPTKRFTAHAVCSSTPWLNGHTSPDRESYHPNSIGHIGYRAVLGRHVPR